MKDNDVIKALECCSMQSYPACKECPYHDNYSKGDCISLKNADIKDLINRQKAEIERLKNECFCLANERDAYKDVLDTTVTEARKEFAERLKEKAEKTTWISNGELVVKDYEISRKEFDNLLAEMERERE